MTTERANTLRDSFREARMRLATLLIRPGRGAPPLAAEMPGLPLSITDDTAPDACPWR
jgi:hypothetical protein